MKELGIVRKLDELGRVVVPKEMRKSLGWAKDTDIQITATKNGVYLEECKTASVAMVHLTALETVELEGANKQSLFNQLVQELKGMVIEHEKKG